MAAIGSLICGPQLLASHPQCKQARLDRSTHEKNEHNYVQSIIKSQLIVINLKLYRNTKRKPSLDPLFTDYIIYTIHAYIDKQAKTKSPFFFASMDSWIPWEEIKMKTKQNKKIQRKTFPQRMGSDRLRRSQPVGTVDTNTS